MSSKSSCGSADHHLLPIPKLSTLSSSSSSLSPSLMLPSSRTRNVFIVKSLGVIVAFTLLVLAINYYLISNCPTNDGAAGAASMSSSSNNAGMPTSRLRSGGDTNRLGEGETTHQPPVHVTITVYYEVLCPDSKHFILKQLVPVYNKYERMVKIEFVPFGKATVARRESSGGGYKFTCQHGPEECHGNKLHACAAESYVRRRNETTLALNIISCSMEKFRLWGATTSAITSVMEECRNQYDAAATATDLMCSDASELLAKHGKETLSLKPKVSFIPTIAIDHSTSNQAQILRDLDSVVCSALYQKQQRDHSISSPTLNC